MDLNPPAGSNISISHDDLDPTVVIPAKPGASRYFGVVFLLCWLVGWAFGFTSAAMQLMEGRGGLFIIVWLVLWTAGGALAVFTAYRLIRPPLPETLCLRGGHIDHDSGIPPLQFSYYARTSGNRDYWKSLFAKRTRVSFDRQQLQSMRLRETGSGNRLTIDVGTQRLELASQASEIEREWLARMIGRRYAIASLSGDSVARP